MAVDFIQIYHSLDNAHLKQEVHHIFSKFSLNRLDFGICSSITVDVAYIECDKPPATFSDPRLRSVEALEGLAPSWRPLMPSTKSQTKSAKIIGLLSRTKGTALSEICKVTNWKSHSVRAFLAGLRKRGFVLTREQRGDDGTAYRITQNPSSNEAKGAA
ncbi:DUF3489 domain-containing protein [Parasphingorhabdus cellanae]|uniref:DUF3489 domain-containing protein n=1 Tax=Parasphingorhabdus cellanae TaxID=2806553 RepID=A0ABX7SYX4_9SPHN|nr:DUF3489 domain-containing protein [Parasphingorhabdus cellanae]QTD54474.1 DUF3489 domain-containing protein [Parasphingorhabdus cellanae]